MYTGYSTDKIFIHTTSANTFRKVNLKTRDLKNELSLDI
jgi:hypothetical protein